MIKTTMIINGIETEVNVPNILLNKLTKPKEGNFGGGVESEIKPTPNLKPLLDCLDLNISNLIKMNEEGLLSEKGKDLLIDLLMMETQN